MLVALRAQQGELKEVFGLARLHTNGLDALEDEAVAVVIGDENRAGPYQDMSFVLARYGPQGGAGGILGVLGPTRMQYGEAVANVRYVSAVLTELMRDFYGNNED